MGQFSIISIILFLIVGQAWLCLSANNTTWDCSKYYENITLTYTRDSYCYVLINAISLEGQDPLLMNSTTSRTSFEKVNFCAKAAFGRGFQQFFLEDGRCFSDSSLNYNGYIHCPSPCQCGADAGYGGLGYYNVYYISTNPEVQDVFNNTVKMFRKTSPRYIHLYNIYKSALDSYFREYKFCGITKVGPITNTFIRPKNGTGPIVVHFEISTNFINAKVQHEKLKTLPYEKLNVTEFSTRQISGKCSEEAHILKFTFDGNGVIDSPTEVSRLGFNLSFTMESKCVTSIDTEVNLKVARITESGKISTFKELCTYNITVNITSGNIICNVGYFALYDGVHFVIGEASTPKHPTMRGFDHTFIKVKKAPLYANFTMECPYAMGTKMYLNGTGSYDTNLFNSAKDAVDYPNDLKYTWICFKSRDGVNPVDPNEIRNLRIVENGDDCFGSGPGRLKWNTRTTIFESTSLSSGQRIYFRLFVEKDSRYYVTASLDCSVVKAPPKFGLHCAYNCGPLMKSTSRIAVIAYCNDDAQCGSSTSLRHSWKFFMDTGRRMDVGENNETVWEPYETVKNLTETTNINIVVDELSFEQNKTYSIQHIVKNSENGARKTNYNFTTNRYPHSGTCMANRKELQAVVDNVTITCKDWLDDHWITIYEAWVFPSSNEGRLIYFGNSSSFTLHLPLGNSSNNFTLKIEIKIFDIYESARFPMNLTVFDPNLDEDTFFTLINRNDGNEQTEAQRGIGAISLFNTSYSNISKAFKTKIRKAIISKMTNVSANSTQSINQVAGVLIDSTSKTDELSSEGQKEKQGTLLSSVLQTTPCKVLRTTDVCTETRLQYTMFAISEKMQSIKAAFNMSESLQGVNSTDDPAVFEQVGTTLLHLTGNVLDGAAANNASKSNNAKALGETAVNTTDTIYKVLIKRMMGGEDTKPFVTPSLGLKISKAKSNKQAKSYGVHGGVIEVPPEMIKLIENSTKCAQCPAAEDFVSTKMFFYGSNPYIWGNGSIKVNSPVVSLDYYRNNSHSIPVVDLDSEFVIRIPTNTPFKPSEKDLFLTPGQECGIHKFNITNNDTSFETIIRLERETFVTVYVRYNQRPTEEEYDYAFHHPNLSSCVEPPERDNCTGVVDFRKCMGLNRTLLKLNEERCTNITVPDVDFLSNTSNPRDQEACIDYHNAVTCSLECRFNSSGKNRSLDGSQVATGHGSYSSLCNNLTSNNSTGNNRSEVCQKVKDFLYCSNTSVEKYDKCKGLLTKKKLIYGKYDNCSENIYRTFFGLDRFRQAGWYYVAICYPQNHINSTAVPTTPSTQPTLAAKVTTRATGQTNKYNSSDNAHNTESIKKKQELTTTSEKRDDNYDGFLDRGEEAFYDSLRINTQDRILNRSRRETTQRKCAEVREKSAPTTNPPVTIFRKAKSRMKRPEFNGSSSLNYSFDINQFTCLFWIKAEESWSSKGCQPHRNSTPSLVICTCNHLTSFGTSMLLTPNGIDFDEVFASFDKDNLSVLFTVIGLFLLYALAVIFARKADKRYFLLLSKTRVGSIDPGRGGYNYEIAVSTGTFRGSGTTANVALTMVGDKGKSQTIPLVDETGSSEELLSRGNVAYLVVNIPEDIGDIIYIEIWHDNRGKDPAWFMRQIIIRDMASNEKWLFLHNDWFAVDRADRKIERRIYAASESDKFKFKTLFYSHTSKSFSDKHLWISVILRPPSSSFTCLQRVTCCFSFLMCTMLANAMFYETEGGPENTFHVGPIKFSLKEFIIGIESGIIVAPINILIIMLFRKARRKTKTTKDDGSSAQDKEPNKEDLKKEKRSKEKAKKKGLPHCCIYVAYGLCVLSVLTSAAFVTFYSMMWGTEKSNKWIISVIFSIIQDILLIQPLKVIILAMVLSAIFHRPPEEDVIEGDQNTEQLKPQEKKEPFDRNMFEVGELNMYNYEPPNSDEVASARDYQIKKNALRSTIKEMVWHLMFVLLLSVAVFGSQSSHRYQLHDHLDKLFSNKTLKVGSCDKFWQWCEQVLLPGLYDTNWYNGKNFTDEKEGFISNKKALLIGMPRMRQAQVKEEECTATKGYPKLQEMFDKCYPDYTMPRADESLPSNALSSHKSTLNDSVLNGGFGVERMCLQPFMVQSAEKLGTLPVVTNDAMYPGSGMVADLGYDNSTASEVVLNLKADNWITRQTRAIFVEFVVFEPTSKLYAFAQFSFEQKSIGFIFPSKSIETYALYGTGQASFDTLLFLIQSAFIVFILVCLVKEGIKIFKLKMLYFKDPWNIYELAIIGLTISMVTMTFVREMYVRNLIKAIQKNPYSRMSFDYVKYGTDVWKTTASLVVFLATLKLLKLLNFNKKILALAQVMELSRPFLVSYGFFFFVTFMAFAQCGNLIFGQQMFMYSTIVRSIVNVFQMPLGKGLFFHELKDIATILGPLFILCYFLVTTLLLVNFFVSILNDSHAEGSMKIEDETNEEAIMAAFVSSYVKSSLRDISEELKQLQVKRRRYGRRRNYRLNMKRKPADKQEDKQDYEASIFLY